MNIKRFCCLLLITLVAFQFTTSQADAQRKRRGRANSTPAVPEEPVLKQDSAKEKPKAKPVSPEVKKLLRNSKPSQFVRIKEKDGKPLSLDTAIVRYVPREGKSGIVVDLVGVVHVGDTKYYERLNRRFENYDVVLYELVAPKGKRIPRGGVRSDNPLAMIQELMTLVLQLDMQTRCIDYTCTNFVHADLSPQEMAQAIKKRGDDSLTLTLSIAADILRNINKMEEKGNANPFGGAGDNPLGLLLDPKGPAKLKTMMARQLEQVGNGTGLGKTLNTILIDDRNAACMKVFQKEVIKGKKKIAIFYGAAHMPDFERRLRGDYGMRKESVEWYTAWDLRPREINLLELMNRLNRLNR